MLTDDMTTCFKEQTVLLSDWLHRWKKVLSPHMLIPAEQVGVVDIQDMWNVLDGEPAPSIDALSTACDQQYDEFVRTEQILRWDCCAPGEIKRLISMRNGGTRYRPEFAQWIIDDVRLLDIVENVTFQRKLSTNPKVSSDQTLILWKRPWVQGRIVDGWPVEFRVFVANYEVVAVSNYFPQRPLDFNFWSDMATKAYELTKPLLSLISSFTADWILTQQGDLRLIECGPPHTATCGAHPCCFAPGKVQGIALTAREGSVEIPSYVYRDVDAPQVREAINPEFKDMEEILKDLTGKKQEPIKVSGPEATRLIADVFGTFPQKPESPDEGKEL